MLLSLRGQIEENDGDADGMLRDLTGGDQRSCGRSASGGGCPSRLGSYADALTKRGEFDEATAALEESLRLTRELNPHDEPAFQQIWLATMQARSGDVEGARADLTRFVDESARRPRRAQRARSR